VSRRRASVLVVGVGGLGCPAALALARAGIGHIGICDDDVVEATNLHRQILFGERDIGSCKVDAAIRELRRWAPDASVRGHGTRLLPDIAVEIVRGYDVVVEGSDNFPTKFLAADACALAGTPIVHASAVRWMGTVLAVGAQGKPCYRCLFEDVPGDGAPTCADAGVMGPVLGVIAAAQIDLALALLEGAPVTGQLVTFDGRTDVLRRRTISPRAGCALCGQAPDILRIEPTTYTSAPYAG
jgi:molybdopterin/thiamine biosynthesis adenylyltransferase